MSDEHTVEMPSYRANAIAWCALHRLLGCQHPQHRPVGSMLDAPVDLAGLAANDDR